MPAPKSYVITRDQRLRARHLLDMMYAPDDLVYELGLQNVRHIYRVLIPAGMPHTKDETGHIWIHGLTFKEWAANLTKSGIKLAEDEVYCVGCRAVRRIVSPTIRQSTETARRKSIAYLQGQCDVCGKNVIKAIRHKA